MPSHWKLCILIALAFSGFSCQSAPAQPNIAQANLPESWTIVPISPVFFPTQQAFALTNPSWKIEHAEFSKDYIIGDYPIYISLYPGSLAQSGSIYGWVHQENQWWFMGKRDMLPAQYEAGDTWKLLIGRSQVGQYAQPNTNAVDIPETSALIAVIDFDQGYILVINANSAYQDAASFRMIIDRLCQL
jgi:hypothetical protein